MENKEFYNFYSLIYNAKTNDDWENILKLFTPGNINLQEQGGNTLLHSSISTAPLWFLQAILEMEADPNKTEFTDNRTAAFYADGHRPSPEKHELLIQFGLNVNHQDNSGWTAGYYCCCVSASVLKIYLQNGLDLTLKSISGRTILFEVIENGKEKIPQLELLAKFGMDFNEPDGYGVSPILFAVSREDDKIVEFLLKQGVDISKKSTRAFISHMNNRVPIPPGTDVKMFWEIIKQWRASPHDENWVLTYLQDSEVSVMAIHSMLQGYNL